METWRAAQIGGIALSTTSLAVVYALLVETGLSASRIGQLSYERSSHETGGSRAAVDHLRR